MRGTVLAQKEIEILPEDNSTSLFDKMAICAGELLLSHFEEICSGKAVYVEQDESQVVFSPVLSKEEEHIDLNQDDEHILKSNSCFFRCTRCLCIIKRKEI